ncbi:MAG: flagellar motor protein MotA [Alphaproteobacteria bacterium]|nr:flagellar motor protein MotA [Alphaproteobacteria bacterium]
MTRFQKIYYDYIKARDITMTKHFHNALNLMALFTALLVAAVMYFWAEFIEISTANIWLNGVIIGTTIFGIGQCFVHMFRLLPEYKWLHGYINKKRNIALAPDLLRPVAQILTSRPSRISANDVNGLLDMILMRFDDTRESINYITNTLIFLGLLGTFWGLILTVGGFAEIIGGLNFADESVLQTMQAGMTKPLAGMATAFTSSLLGLGGSLAVGFLGLQVQIAQNTMYHQLEDFLAKRTNINATQEIARILPQINLATRELTRTIQNIDQDEQNV